MDYTTNYNLKKPAGNENVGPGAFNENADIIDEQLKNNADSAANKIPNSLATAVSQFLVSTGVGEWAVKTIAEIKTLLGLKSAAYTDSSNYTAFSSGATNPSTSTVGVVGQLYLMDDGVTQSLYKCVAVSEGVYTWKPASLNIWSQIQAYTAAGNFTWTAPDLYGDGLPYDIYAIVDSGGGSGAASARKYSSQARNAATGGASGCRKIVKLTVTPGSTYAVVVGAGGGAVSITAGPANVSTTFGTDGNSGGSSSFNGVSVLGGSGGKWDIVVDTIDSLFAGNGVMPDSIYFIFQNYSTVGARRAPSRGAASLRQTTDAGAIPVPNPVVAFELANPFDSSEGLFSAGGGAVAYSTSVCKSQPVETLSDGFSAGAGYAVYLAAIAENLTRTGNSATSHSSGGGGTAFGVAASDTTYTVTAVSGAGADGQVRIYARRAS